MPWIIQNGVVSDQGIMFVIGSVQQEIQLNSSAYQK